MENLEQNPNTTHTTVEDVPCTLQEDDDISLRRILRAWDCILLQYQKKAADTSLLEGEGLNVFRMLRSKKGDSNCEYFFAERNSPFWNSAIKGLPEPEKDNFLARYDKGDVYAIVVSVPLHDTGDETLQQIRLFDIVNSKEIEW